MKCVIGLQCKICTTALIFLHVERQATNRSWVFGICDAKTEISYRKSSFKFEKYFYTLPSSYIKTFWAKYQVRRYDCSTAHIIILCWSGCCCCCCCDSDDTSCPVAFRHCHLDEVCASRLDDFLSVCSWNISSSDCRRSQCSDSIRRFVSLVQAEVVQSLLFCGCAKSTDDENCHVIQRGVVPACTSIEMPPPSCSDVIARCNEEPGCR